MENRCYGGRLERFLWPAWCWGAVRNKKVTKIYFRIIVWVLRLRPLSCFSVSSSSMPLLSKVASEVIGRERIFTINNEEGFKSWKAYGVYNLVQHFHSKMRLRVVRWHSHILLVHLNFPCTLFISLGLWSGGMFTQLSKIPESICKHNFSSQKYITTCTRTGGFSGFSAIVMVEVEAEILIGITA